MHNRLIKTIFLFGVLCLGPSAASAQGEALNSDEAKRVLKDLVPNAKVLYVQQAPVAGLWEVGIDADGKKGILYIDHARKHLVSGSVVDISTKANLTQESFQKINKVDISLVPLKDAVVMGDKSAKNKVIVFDDPD